MMLAGKERALRFEGGDAGPELGLARTTWQASTTMRPSIEMQRLPRRGRKLTGASDRRLLCPVLRLPPR